MGMTKGAMRTAVVAGFVASATMTAPVAQAAGLTDAYNRQTDHQFRKGLQTRLAWTGDYEGAFNGRIDARSLRAIRDFQARHGMTADGVITEAMLQRLLAKSDAIQSELDVSLVSDADTGADLLLPQGAVVDAGQTEVGHMWRADGRALEVETVRIADTGQTLSGLYDVLTTATADRTIADSHIDADGFDLSGTAGDRHYYMQFAGQDGDLRGFSVSYETGSGARFEPYVTVAANLFEPFANEPATSPQVAQREPQKLSEIIAEQSGGEPTGAQGGTRYAMADTDRADGNLFELPSQSDSRPAARSGGPVENGPTTSPEIGGSDFAMAGSGFVVSRDGWLVTNAHVVRSCRTVRVGKDAIATRTVLDENDDLALIKVGEDVGEPLSIAEGKPRLGEDILALGYPLRSILADSLNVTTGNVSSLKGLMNDPRYMQISAPIQPGNSGGPLIDHAGRVSGVVTAKLNAVAVADATGDIPQSINFAIHTGKLKAFLEAHDVNYQTADPDAEMASVPDATAAVKDSVKPVVCTERF